MKHFTRLQAPGQPNDAKRFDILACAKVGLSCAAGPLAVGLLFVIVWIIGVPTLEWTATGFKPWNAAWSNRLGVVLGLFVIELPFAIGLGILLCYREVTSYWGAALTCAKIAACISIPSLAGFGCMISLASRGHNVVAAHELVEMVGEALVVLTKEVAAGVSCGVIAAANVRRLKRLPSGPSRRR